RSGDASAGAALIARHTELLARFFANKASEAMDDLLQATFLRCVESRDAVRDPAKFRSYLLTIAHRELLAYFRKRSRERDLFAPDTTSVWDLDPSPSTVVVEREEQRLLAEALRRVPLSFQIALELYYWQELSAPEISEVLEVPEGTVRSRLRRGRELLLRRMQSLRSSDVRGRPSLDDLERWARQLRGTL
ncbi:MAG: sigma-70 family RNA polymerase sigma factor, partial [Nannocystaceae bacterium]|nr:sigma-70 family RNA polymerase sigma factor [Nannocystaceae bacterium]